jgi:hypothetical protein
VAQSGETSEVIAMEEESQTSLVHHLRFGLTLPVMLMLLGRRARERRAGSVASCRDPGTRSDALAEMFARRRAGLRKGDGQLGR